MGGDRLNRKFYDWSKSLADKVIKNWAKHTFDLLHSLCDSNFLQSPDLDSLWDAITEQEG